MILTFTTSSAAAIEARGTKGIAETLEVAKANAITKNDVLIKVQPSPPLVLVGDHRIGIPATYRVWLQLSTGQTLRSTPLSAAKRPTHAPSHGKENAAHGRL